MEFELNKIELKEIQLELNKRNCNELEWELELIESNLPQPWTLCAYVSNYLSNNLQCLETMNKNCHSKMLMLNANGRLFC